jgi:hypothetical protein
MAQVSSILLGGNYMYIQDISDGEVVISGSVHRKLNDIISEATHHKVSGWEQHYTITIGLDGQLKARPKGENPRGLESFEFGLNNSKLVFLPNPSWVQSEQKVYICFDWEVAELQKRWWDGFVRWNH